MIAQILCFTGSTPTPDEAQLIVCLTSNGHIPLVDSTHNYKAWFTNNFHLVSHRVFYNKPFPQLLAGTIEEVDFEIMGRPHFVVYYTTSLEDAKVPDEYEWRCIVKYMDEILNAEDKLSDEELKVGKACLGAYKTMVPIAVDEDEETEVGEFVIERSLEDYYYKFESKFIKEADLMIYQVTKPFVERPFTVLVEKFSHNGARSLFTDLFNCPDWGREHIDIQFLESLWRHLDLLDDAPFDIEKMLECATAACYPNESGEIRSEPRVYRRAIGQMEEIYGARFLSK